MNRLLLAISMFALMTVPAFADTIDVGGGLVLDIAVQPDWTIPQEPPAALVEEIAEHIGHEAEEQGASPTRAQLLQVARQRLAANEAIIYHESGAHLDIDFSPLDAGEKPPAKKTLRNSAKYAAQSLQSEEGVSDVVWEVQPFEVKGARDAFLLSADYQQHAEPVRFLGVIGSAGNQWFFLYYTDRGKSAGTFEAMQEMLASVEIRTAGE